MGGLEAEGGVSPRVQEGLEELLRLKTLAPADDPDYWKDVEALMEEAVKQGVSPGLVAVVGKKGLGPVFSYAAGHYTYGAVPPYNKENPAMTEETLFDLASLSKILATTTVTAKLYQEGLLALDTRVTEVLGAQFGQYGKQDITVLNLLLHNAGYPPDPTPEYWSPQFGCPNTNTTHPAMDNSCRDRIYNALFTQTLENPVGSTYVYSDLSMMTMAYICGTVIRSHGLVHASDLLEGCAGGGPSDVLCYFEAYLRVHLYNGFASTGYLPPLSDADLCAPTENDTSYQNKQIQGQVSDGNAYASGGIQGHAGLFSNAKEAHAIVSTVWTAWYDTNLLLNATTVDLFRKQYDNSSSRALGWNTNANQFDQGWNHSCGSLSPRTYMHLGYTGTQICVDPDREAYTLLFTNRVYPTADNIKIRAFRQQFNDLCQKKIDAFPPHGDVEEMSRSRHGQGG